MTVLETKTRVRVARAFGKNELDATVEAFRLLFERNGMCDPPPLASDGHNGCGEAMKQIWGKVPPYKGVGPRPKYKAAGENWQHLKVIKNRNQKEVSAFCEKQVVFGKEELVTSLLGTGTVHLERSHLTMRNFDARITRRGLGASKKLQMHRLAATWQDTYYNLCHEVRTLKIPIENIDEMNQTPKFKQKWKHRTPMMAAQITDHTWTVKELLYTLSTANTHQLFDG